MCDILWNRIVPVKGSEESSQSVALCVTVVTHRNFATYTSVICHVGSEDELDQYHTQLRCFELFLAYSECISVERWTEIF